jgi:hypothetical protein
VNNGTQLFAKAFQQRVDVLIGERREATVFISGVGAIAVLQEIGYS